MFSFHWPWFALLLPLPLLIWRLWPRPHGATDAYAYGDRSTLLHPALGRLASTFVHSRSLTHAGSRLQIVLLALLFLLSHLALVHLAAVCQHRSATARTQHQRALLALAWQAAVERDIVQISRCRPCCCLPALLILPPRAAMRRAAPRAHYRVRQAAAACPAQMRLLPLMQAAAANPGEMRL